MDTEQNLFDREFDDIVNGLGPEASARYQKGREVESLKISLLDEAAQGVECDEAVFRSNLRLLNELAAELDQFGRVRITGDILVQDGDDVVHYEIKQPIDATLREYNLNSSPDHTMHALVYEFEDILIDGEPTQAVGAVDMINLLPVIKDSPSQ